MNVRSREKSPQTRSLKGGLFWITGGVVALSTAVVATSFWTYHRASLAGFFTVGAIDVSFSGGQAAGSLTAEDIRQLSGVRVGFDSLVGLDLARVEERLLRDPWVKQVVVAKQFPATVKIELSLREAVLGIARTESSRKLHYLDREGVAFAPWNPKFELELPILLGVPTTDAAVIALAREWAGLWRSVPELAQVELATLRWDRSLGLQASVAYPLATGSRVHTRIGLGSDSPQLDPAQARGQLQRLAQVINHLSQQGMVARQIWADLGKKIVVKTAPGS